VATAVAVVPARGGSKGIPRKNLRPFLGKPLVDWTIEAARASGAFERILLTTDDEEIAARGREGRIEVIERPPELAGDEVGTAPAVRHALVAAGAGCDLVLVLEPTSPARRPRHVLEAARLLDESGADSLASVSEVPYHHTAEKQLNLGPDGSLEALNGTAVGAMKHRRQDVAATYAFNGLIWGCRRDVLLGDPPTLWGERVVGYVVEPRYAVDLDRPEDWAAAEARVRELLAQEAP
jgi:CMP-N-acetylneuraminic acid synthetase